MSYIELIYSPNQDKIVVYKVPYVDKKSVAYYLESSKLLESHPEVKNLSIGIFSTIVTLDHIVKIRDRIEIYRPLSASPKERRKRHAKQTQKNHDTNK